MKDLFGIGSTNPYKIRKWINSYHAGLSDEKKAKFKRQLIGPGEKYNGKALVVMCLYFQSFLDNKEALEENKTVVIVVDSPIILGNAGIELVDCVEAGGFRWVANPIEEHQFHMRLLQGLKSKSAGDIQQVDLLQNLIDYNKGDLSSFIQKITMISRVPEKRREILMTITGWLLRGKGDKTLLESCLGHLEMAGNVVKETLEFFDTPVGQDAIKVFAEIEVALNPRIKGKKRTKGSKSPSRKKVIVVPYERICKDTQISVFDAKYLMKAYRVDYHKVNISSKDAATYRPSEDQNDGRDTYQKLAYELAQTIEDEFDVENYDTQAEYNRDEMLYGGDDDEEESND